MKKIKSILGWFLKLSLFKKLIIVVVLSVLGWFGWANVWGQSEPKPQYQTSTAEKGTLVVSVSGSGSIKSGNSTNLNTKASGVVKSVYVTNGDSVEKGQKIAEIDLDERAEARQASSWVSYLKAIEAVKDAETAMVTADIQMWNDRQAIIDAEDHIDYIKTNPIDPETNEEYDLTKRTVADKSLDEAYKAFDASEKKYLDSDANIVNARDEVVSALRDYQENSAILVAPASGVISDLSLAPGVTIAASSTTSNTSGATIISAQTVGKVNDPDGQLIATVDLSEIDIIHVKANQRVTMTLDAYIDKDFTGKVLGVNTSGSVSQGVTTYPVTILLDPVTLEIYPNMGVNASIITKVVSDVVLVPSSAVQTTNGDSSVRILKNGVATSVPVVVGESNDSQTEIISGINEGDAVITGSVSTGSNSSQGSSSSPFGSFGGRGFGR